MTQAVESFRDFVFSRELELNCRCQQVAGAMDALETRTSVALARPRVAETAIQTNTAKMVDSPAQTEPDAEDALRREVAELKRQLTWTSAFYTRARAESEERGRVLAANADEIERLRRENEGLAAQAQDLQEIISAAQEHPGRGFGPDKNELLGQILESSQVVQQAEDEICAERASGRECVRESAGEFRGEQGASGDGQFAVPAGAEVVDAASLAGCCAAEVVVPGSVREVLAGAFCAVSGL